MSKISDYPTDAEIETASRETLARWQRFLVGPGTQWEERRLKRILERFKEKGGMTPELSKKIGWGWGESKTVEEKTDGKVSRFTGRPAE